MSQENVEIVRERSSLTGRTRHREILATPRSRVECLSGRSAARDGRRIGVVEAGDGLLLRERYGTSSDDVEPSVLDAWRLGPR